MKSLIFFAAAALLVASCNDAKAEAQPETLGETEPTALTTESLTPEQTAVRESILESYIDGLQNDGDTLAIDAGFHPVFELLGKGEDGTVWSRPIQQWRDGQVERVKKGEFPRKDPDRVTATFDFIDVTQDVAVAKLRYYQSGEHVYTDYLSLYRFGAEWKIVSKVFTKIE